jgi:uncharacterized protein (DUF488 family)
MRPAFAVFLTVDETPTGQPPGRWRYLFMRFYTLGYQGIYLETFIEALHSENIGTLLDVRAVPWSRREEFIKRNLNAALTNAGIKYLHLERAGNPAAKKQETKIHEKIYENYHAYIAANPGVLEEVLIQLKIADDTGKPACLMCKESDPAQCHRSALVTCLLEKDPTLEPVHLIIGAHRDTESGFLSFMETGVLRVLSNGQPLIRV